ncbi:MAG: NUDIX domain-containing protein [Kiritimatiellia bacterium]|jgi:8-oxo-dGTP diphosphatase
MAGDSVLPPGEQPGVIETIVRGVFVRGGRILLCRSKGSPLAYLPGGHIEFREQAAHALAREVREELGQRCVVGDFLGCCENTFLQKGEWHAEIFLAFAMVLPDLPPGPAPSREDWIEFLWWPVDRLWNSRLEPAILRTRLAGWLEPGSLARNAFATTPSGWEDVPAGQ